MRPGYAPTAVPTLSNISRTICPRGAAALRASLSLMIDCGQQSSKSMYRSIDRHMGNNTFRKEDIRPGVARLPQPDTASHFVEFILEGSAGSQGFSWGRSNSRSNIRSPLPCHTEELCAMQGCFCAFSIVLPFLSLYGRDQPHCQVNSVNCQPDKVAWAIELPF